MSDCRVRASSPVMIAPVCGRSTNGHGKSHPLIMKLAMPVFPYPTFPRKREKGQTNRYASFTLKSAHFQATQRDVQGERCFHPG